MGWLFMPVVLLLCGCSATHEFSQDTPTTSDVVQSRAKWLSMDRGDYRYTISTVSFTCGTPQVDVVVRRGSVQRAVYAVDSSTCRGGRIRRGELVTMERLRMIRTIPEIFEAIDSCRGDCVVNAQFDLETGTPVFVRFSHREIEDDFSILRISRLKR